VIVDPLKFRNVMGHFPTGVSVLTTVHEGEQHGMTANSIASVSLDPVMILACLSREARTALAIQSAGRFAVNILGEHQEDVSRRFARPGQDHFEGLDVTEAMGLPILPGCLAYLICEVHEVVTAGDHDIVLGNVEHCDLGASNGASPLVFFQGGYRTLPGMGRLG